MTSSDERSDELDAPRAEDSVEDPWDELQRVERLATVRRLASHMAHELGTPLNVIAGRAMMIASGETVGEESISSARIIVEQAHRLTALIKQLLSEARRPSQRAANDFVALAARAISMLERRAESHGVKLILDGEPGPLWVEVDPMELVQVLTSILTNAIQAMPAGGIVNVSMGRESPPGVLSRKNGGGNGNGWASVAVRDHGEGIAKEDLPKIFKLFYTTRGQAHGAGLGLSIVQAFVREHGGYIDVESEKGKGTCLKVFLPDGRNIDAGTRPDRG